MRPPRPLRIVIPGGTGRLGSLLARHFYDQGHSVAAITRFPNPKDWEAVHWDAENPGEWAASIDGADVVINLAGQSFHCRHTAANKRAIMTTNVRTALLLGEAISESVHPPRVWLNASSVDIYPDALDVDPDEYWSPQIAPTGFVSGVAKAVEDAVSGISTPSTRKVLMRLAFIMSPNEGSLFTRLLRVVRAGLGGEIGSGEQYVTWIHDFDFVRAIEFLIGQDNLAGAVNITAPVSLPSHQLMRDLRDAWCSNYFGLPIPEWLVHAASFVLRSEPQELLKSRRVLPSRLLRAGFCFDFPDWRGACENLVERWRFFHPGA